MSPASGSGRRVVYCTYDNPGNISGPNAWLRRLLPELRRAGLAPEAWFFSLDANDSPTVEALIRTGIPARVFPFHSGTRAKMRWLLQQASDAPPAVFVANHVVPALLASGWLRPAGIPTVGVLHSDDAFYHAVVREFAGACGSWRISDLVCVSQYLHTAISQQVDRSVRLHAIPYGVPVPEQSADHTSDRLELVYVGRFEEEQKRIFDVAHALCRAVLEVPRVRARMIGDGPALPAVRGLLHDQGVADRVELVGRVDSDRVQSELLRSQAIVLLSDYEGLPIALMEGMACGLVPICTRIESGIPELVQDGRNGMIVDDRGDSFVAAVRSLQAAPDLRVRLSAAARETIVANYSAGESARRWRDLLLQLAEQGLSAAKIVVPGRIDLPPRQREFAREDFRIHQLLARTLDRLGRLGRSG